MASFSGKVLGSKELSITKAELRGERNATEGVVFDERLAELKAQIGAAKADARRATLKSLEAHRRTGELLTEAKELFEQAGKREFTAWVSREFGIGREWSSQLRKLAQIWPIFEVASKEAEEQGLSLDLSVAGALRMAERHQGGDAQHGVAEENEDALANGGIGEQHAAADQHGDESESTDDEVSEEAPSNPQPDQQLGAMNKALLKETSELRAENKRLVLEIEGKQRSITTLQATVDYVKWHFGRLKLAKSAKDKTEVLRLLGDRVGVRMLGIRFF